MGFLDKAKKLAEQAQTKLDEVQSQINTSGASRPPTGPVVEYDKHGRPIPPQPSDAPPEGGAPPTGPMQTPPPSPPAPPAATPPGAAAGPPPAPGVPPTEPPTGPPAPIEGSAPPPPTPGLPGNDEDPRRGDYTPPKLTGGDPLAG
jgi:hypothetical protein